MKAWLTHHVHSLRLAMQRLAEAPLATLFSVLVIGVALSLPAGLYLLLFNVQQVAGHVPTAPELTLYLKNTLNETSGRKLTDTLQARRDIAKAHFISREDGLKLLESGGLSDLLAGLESNPLPHAITLIAKTDNPDALEQLATELRQLPETDKLSLDSDWARRLSALLKFGERLVWMLAGVLGLALAAITGNTIRLQIYALREEIEVSRLIGATDRFIRRPFVYFGALQGLLGGMAAWLLVTAAMLILSGLADDLALAYGTHYVLSGLGLTESAAMLGAATLLGLLGAWLAVDHSLSRIDR